MVKERMDKNRVVSNEIREELERELKHLRVLVREIGENFILRQEGEIECAINNLEALPPGKLRTMAPALLQELRRLKVKPAKGRLKDLKELNRVVDDLTHHVIDAQERGKGPSKG